MLNLWHPNSENTREEVNSLLLKRVILVYSELEDRSGVSLRSFRTCSRIIEGAVGGVQGGETSAVIIGRIDERGNVVRVW